MEKMNLFLKNIENILKNNLTKAEEYLNNFKKMKKNCCNTVR